MGVEEESVVVVTQTPGEVSALMDLARRHGQESVLLVVAGEARLVYMDGLPSVQLGAWRTAGTEKPDADAWTYDPTTGLYWVAGGDDVAAPNHLDGGVA